MRWDTLHCLRFPSLAHKHSTHTHTHPIKQHKWRAHHINPSFSVSSVCWFAAMLRCAAWLQRGGRGRISEQSRWARDTDKHTEREREYAAAPVTQHSSASLLPPSLRAPSVSIVTCWGRLARQISQHASPSALTGRAVPQSPVSKRDSKTLRAWRTCHEGEHYVHIKYGFLIELNIKNVENHAS